MTEQTFTIDEWTEALCKVKSRLDLDSCIMLDTAFGDAHAILTRPAYMPEIDVVYAFKLDGENKWQHATCTKKLENNGILRRPLTGKEMGIKKFDAETVNCNTNYADN